MTKAMEAILAWRFAPLNFSVVPSFPNLVPPPSEWMDYLPVFKEEKEDNPAQHLVTFHQCMDQLGILHEDVLMKMFMYSLKGDAREWYFSLPASSICSLRDFHVAFNKHCKRYFPHELLLEDCCEKYESRAQRTIYFSSYDELYEGLAETKIKEELVCEENILNSSIKEEIFQDQKIVDHVNHCLNQSVYDIFEVEQTPFVGYEEEKVSFQQTFVAGSYNEPIIEKDYEHISQVISLNGPPLFDHYGDSDVEDQEQPLICEDQRFNIFNHESKNLRRGGVVPKGICQICSVIKNKLKIALQNIS
jgi:hypothetical protein